MKVSQGKQAVGLFQRRILGATDNILVSFGFAVTGQWSDPPVLR